jgi:DNA repair protein RecO (recombination protein O)
MNINDEAIIIDKILLKEDSVIVKSLTRNHGLLSGVTKSNVKKQKYLPQKGDLVDFFWQARLIDHLGYCKIELTESNFSFIMLDKKKIYSINTILELINLSFKERDPHPLLFNYLNNYLKNIAHSKFSFLNHILMEINILSECGYGLDLTKCASTGTFEDLFYVSPKSGKAVSKFAGEKYKNSLLKLPQFILHNKEPETVNEVFEADLLMGYFFKRYILSDEKNLFTRNNFFKLIESSYSGSV